jgi:Kdo2-lipid IVA lauroyltransferase/acyltransferase
MRPGTYFKKDLSRFLQLPLNCYLAEKIPFNIFKINIYLLGCCYYLFNIHKIKKMDGLLNILFGNQSSFCSKKLLTIKTICGIFEHYYEKMINAHYSLYGMMDYLCRNIDIENEGWLDNNNKIKKGCLLVSGHFGSVEYLPLFLAAKGYRPTMIVRYKTRKLKDILTFKSKQVGLELIDADQGGVVKDSIRALKEGRILITLCDEFKKWHGSKDEYISVMGRTVPKDKTLDIFYRLTNLPACLGLMMRTNKKYILRIIPLIDGNEESSLSYLAWKKMEQFIFEYPDQWYQWQDFERDLTLYLNQCEKCI